MRLRRGARPRVRAGARARRRPPLGNRTEGPLLPPSRATCRECAGGRAPDPRAKERAPPRGLAEPGPRGLSCARAGEGGGLCLTPHPSFRAGLSPPPPPVARPARGAWVGAALAQGRARRAAGAGDGAHRQAGTLNLPARSQLIRQLAKVRCTPPSAELSVTGVGRAWGHECRQERLAAWPPGSAGAACSGGRSHHSLEEPEGHCSERTGQRPPF